jgi:TolA-binding protein
MRLFASFASLCLACAAPVLLASALPLHDAWGQEMIQSQEGIALENQILALKAQLQQLQSGGNGGSALGGAYAPPPDNSAGPPANGSLVAGLLNQVNQLQSQMQALSGRVDTLQNQVQTQNGQLEKEIGDLRFQLQGGANAPPGGGPNAAQGDAGHYPARPDEGAPAAGTLGSLPVGPGGRPGGGGVPPQAGGQMEGSHGASAARASAVSPKDALAAAQAAYATKDYKDAVLASRAAIAGGKYTSIGVRAQFVLAESLAGQGKNQEAALAYDDAYNADRNGPNAAPALLGLASSLVAIHQTSAACDTLASLNSQFPDAPASLRPRIEAVRHRAGCG